MFAVVNIFTNIRRQKSLCAHEGRSAYTNNVVLKYQTPEAEAFQQIKLPLCKILNFV
jgi:hypothetical protein